MGWFGLLKFDTAVVPGVSLLFDSKVGTFGVNFKQVDKFMKIIQVVSMKKLIFRLLQLVIVEF